MSLSNYTEADRKRIAQMAAHIVEGRIMCGEIPKTMEAIREAMPQAIEDARQLITAAHEFLS